MNSDLVCRLEKSQEMKGWCSIQQDEWIGIGFVPSGSTCCCVPLQTTVALCRSLITALCWLDREMEQVITTRLLCGREEQNITTWSNDTTLKTWQQTKSTENIQNGASYWTESNIFTRSLLWGRVKKKWNKLCMYVISTALLNGLIRVWCIQERKRGRGAAFSRSDCTLCVRGFRHPIMPKHRV